MFVSLIVLVFIGRVFAIFKLINIYNEYDYLFIYKYNLFIVVYVGVVNISIYKNQLYLYNSLQYKKQYMIQIDDSLHDSFKIEL